MPSAKDKTIKAMELRESCVHCDRPIWGAYQPLGLGYWRHEECHAGTRGTWIELQRAKPGKLRSKLFAHFNGTRGN